MLNQRRHPAWVVIPLWAFATLIDLDKPFHVDDTFHLEMGEWIAQHPTAPMSGTITWDEGRVPMHSANQPPGFYYAIALTGSLLGWTEVPMHLMRSLFTLLAIVCFHRLARRYHPRHAIVLTALLALGPAFLVNQGLMVDMPLLALHLLFFDLLLRQRTTNRWREVALAACVLSLGVLVKYTTLPLIAVFPIALAVRKEWRSLVWSTVPLLVILLWSWANVNEFGHAHLFARGAQGGEWIKKWRNLGSLVCGLGAVAPFALLFIGGFRSGWRRCAAIALAVFALLLGSLGLGVFIGWIPERTSDAVLRWIFIVNGALLILVAVRMAIGSSVVAKVDRSILIAWLLGLAIFIILFAPTMGTRHLLLLLPPLLLIGGSAIEGSPVRASWLAVCTTALLGAALTVADKSHARFFQRGAEQAAAELAGERTVWSVGLWGWYWYTRHQGMLIFPDDPHAPRALAPGDVLVKAEGVHAQKLDPAIKLEPLRTWPEPRPWWTFLYVGDFGSMYTADMPRTPWRFDRDARNTITAYRVVEVPAVGFR